MSGRARPAASPSGTQSIERVVGMLRVVASRGRHGMRLGDVTAATGLPSSTCYRMLQRLESDRAAPEPVASTKNRRGSAANDIASKPLAAE